MARGQFLQGLSEGIFERLGGLRQEQEARDAQQKSQVIQMLAGLADQIEPESLPLLMGHMWDTMGIKKQASGKGLRGFLDAFSGMPNRSVEDQLGSKFRELTSGMVGPQAAKDIRNRNTFAQKGIPGITAAAPDSIYGQKAAADVQGLKNKMVFRDPRKEKLEEIETRYGAQLQAALEKETYSKSLAAKYALERDEAKRKGDINKTFYNKILGAQAPQIARAYQLWWEDFEAGKTLAEPGIDPGAIPPQEYMARAGQILTQEQKNKDTATQALGPLRGSLTKKTEAEIKAIGPGGEKLTDRDRRMKAKQAAQQGLDTSEGTVSGLNTKRDTLINQINMFMGGFPGYKFSFDPEKGDLRLIQSPPGVTPETIGQIKGLVADDTKDLLRDYREVQSKIKAEEGKAEGYRKTIKEYESLQPQAPQTLSPPSRRLSRPAGGRIKVPQDQGDQNGYRPGTKTSIGGKQYWIEGFKNGWWVLNPTGQ